VHVCVGRLRGEGWWQGRVSGEMAVLAVVQGERVMEEVVVLLLLVSEGEWW
jgi:hypothetical protein